MSQTYEALYKITIEHSGIVKYCTVKTLMVKPAKSYIENCLRNGAIQTVWCNTIANGKMSVSKLLLFISTTHINNDNTVVHNDHDQMQTTAAGSPAQ